MNFEQIELSSKKADKRLEQAKALFGERVIYKILAWALYLLGASKPGICAALDFKPGTLRTLFHRLQNQGLSALEDGRTKTSVFKPVAKTVMQESGPKPLTATLYKKDDHHLIYFGEQIFIKIPTGNSILLKSTLLCLFNNQQIGRQEVAQALHCSETHVYHLAKKLTEQDVTGLIDQRRGQQHDLVVTKDVKSELIQQFVIDIVQYGKVSAEGLASHLKARCQHELSPRTILNHLDKMGLLAIKKTLPGHLIALKKNCPVS